MDKKDLKDPLIKSLVSEGLITHEQAVTLEIEKERSRSTLAEALRGLSLLDEESLIGFLSDKVHTEVFSLQEFIPEREILELFPPGFAGKYRIVPLEKEGNTLKVGLSDPFKMEAVEELRFHTGLFIKPYLVSKESLDSFISTYCVSLGKTLT